jgi:hypothetical protein
MSRIYFHSEHGTAEVSGVERANAAQVCMRLLYVALGLSDFSQDHDSPLRALLPANESALRASNFASAFRGYCVTELEATLAAGELKTTAFVAALNTAHAMGSDPVRLLARLHGQCELHAYVEGPNRAWLARIIAEGLRSGVMRPRCHWEDAVDLLRSRDDGPVVTSYSVTHSFPNPYVTDWEAPVDPEYGEKNYDPWYEMPAGARWSQAMDGLRSERGGTGLEMEPAGWADFVYGAGINGFQLREAALAATPNANVRW